MYGLARSSSESPKSVRMWTSSANTSPRTYRPLHEPLDYKLLYYDSIRRRRRRRLYSSTDADDESRFLPQHLQHHINDEKRSYSVTDEHDGQHFVFVSEIPSTTHRVSFAPMASTNSNQSGQLGAPTSYRHHASFSEPSSSAPQNQQTAPVVRRESMTRLFLKSDAVFKAYEEIQQQQDQQQQRSTGPPRIKRYTSTEDEPKTKSEPELNDASNSRPQGSQQIIKASNSTTSSQDTTTTHRIQRSTSITQPSASSQFAVEARRRCSAFVAMEGLKKEDPDEVYKINKQLGTGRFGYVKLAEHKASGKTVALKFFPRPQIKQADFIREYNFSKFLCPHQNIIDTFNGVYQANDDSAFYFVQEFAPHASLREMVETSANGIGETNTKTILLSVVSAIDFMHGENLVHRNIKAENILIFNLEDLSKVKVADFGLTRKEDSTVKNLDYTNVYHAPELVDTVVNEFLTVHKSIDIWALGILFYYCLKGRFPWQKASIVCKPYFEWENWIKHKLPQLPRRYDVFTEKALKLQKRCLIMRAKERWTCKDIKRYLEKERLLKPAKIVSKSVSVDDHYEHHETDKKSKSTIHGWISSTLNMVTEISEQVVSAQGK